MYCSKCGAFLPDDANYCLNCGINVKQGSIATDEKYEICTVRFATISGGIRGERWEAWCGKHKIAESKVISMGKMLTGFGYSEAMQQQYSELISSLLSLGWEVMTQDGHGIIKTMKRVTR